MTVSRDKVHVFINLGENRRSSIIGKAVSFLREKKVKKFDTFPDI